MNLCKSKCYEIMLKWIISFLFFFFYYFGLNVFSHKGIFIGQSNNNQQNNFIYKSFINVANEVLNRTNKNIIFEISKNAKTNWLNLCQPLLSIIISFNFCVWLIFYKIQCNPCFVFTKKWTYACMQWENLSNHFNVLNDLLMYNVDVFK